MNRPTSLTKRCVLIAAVTVLTMLILLCSSVYAGSGYTGEKKQNGQWYYFRNGVAQKGFQTIPVKGGGTKTCWYDAKGRMVHGQKRIQGYWYNFDRATGAMKKGWVRISEQNKICYYNAKGRMVYNQQKIGRYWYYFNPKTGAMATGWTWIPEQKKTVYYDKNGRMVYGKQVINGKAYSLNPVTGALQGDAIVSMSGRYEVTCNWNYHNSENVLGRFRSLDQAKDAVSRQAASKRGQWYIIDRDAGNRIVWPDLSTTQKRVDKAVAWVRAIAIDDTRHGYICAGENTGSNGSLQWGRWGSRGDYSCSTLVAMAYELTGQANLRTTATKHTIRMSSFGGAFSGVNSTSIGAAAKRSGKFRDVSGDLRRSGQAGLKPGDILVSHSRHHVGIYVGSGRIVEAWMNETGREYADYSSVRPGDQTGSEIRSAPYDSRWYFAYRPR